MNYVKMAYRKTTRILDENDWPAFDAGDTKQIIIDVIDVTLVLTLIVMLTGVSGPLIALALVWVAQSLLALLGFWALIAGVVAVVIISLIGLRCWLSRQIQREH